MKIESFEDFLKDIHAGQYVGTDDDMPEDFDNWLSMLDADEFMSYGEMYGIKVSSNTPGIFNEMPNSIVRETICILRQFEQNADDAPVYRIYAANEMADFLSEELSRKKKEIE